jgi:hypothetical protein
MIKLITISISNTHCKIAKYKNFRGKKHFEILRKYNNKLYYVYQTMRLNDVEHKIEGKAIPVAGRESL